MLVQRVAPMATPTGIPFGWSGVVLEVPEELIDLLVRNQWCLTCTKMGSQSFICLSTRLRLALDIHNCIS